MAKKPQSKKSLIPLLLVIIGMLVLLGIFKFSSIVKLTKPTPQTETEVLMGVAKDLDIRPEIRDARYWDWIENGQRLPLIGEEFLMGTVNINGIGQYKALANQEDLTQINVKNLEPINQTAESYFTSLGFKQSRRNNRWTNLEASNTEYFGYEKGAMKCVYRLSETTDPFGSFFCGTVDQTQLENQKQFLSMFKKEFDADQFAGFRVDKIEGNYATGAFYNSSMGYQWIAEKNDDEWHMAWNGNEPPMCSTIESLDIPKSIYQICYDQ